MKNSRVTMGLIIVVIGLVSVSAVAGANFKNFNLLPRDHTEISCTNPLQIGLKVFTEGEKKVIFKVYDDSTNALLWTSPSQKASEPFTDVLLSTTITSPPPVIRVEMIDSSGNVLSKIKLEPDCKLRAIPLVNVPTFIYPPPNGCKFLINPNGGQVDGGGGSGGGKDPRGWPTVSVAVASANIGQNIQAFVKDAKGNTLAHSDIMPIDTEMISLNLQSVPGSFPANSFFDVFFEIDINNIPQTKAACTVINGQAVESSLSTSCPQVCNGVCTSTNTDKNNCGACGNVCGASKTCTGGVCVSPSDGTPCDDGNSCTTGDVFRGGACSGTPVTCTASDQCHVAGVCNPSTGQCSNPSAADGIACSDGNACTQTDTCQAGVCTGSNPVTCTTGTCDPSTGACKSSCPTGQMDCGGACVDTSTNVNDCGACGSVCSATNGSPSCIAGTCNIACNAGFGNCDANPANGCETSIETSINNCGGCGNVCTTPNGSPVCTAGQCRVAACNTGFADCDGLAADGCETNLLTSPTSCGACGHSCAVGQACNGGVCTTVTNSCTSDANCLLNQFCFIPSGSSVGICAPKGPSGVSCTSNNECLSGACVAGVCH